MAELVVLNFKAAEGKFDAVADMFRAVLVILGVRWMHQGRRLRGRD